MQTFVLLSIPLRMKRNKLYEERKGAILQLSIPLRMKRDLLTWIKVAPLKLSIPLRMKQDLLP